MEVVVRYLQVGVLTLCVLLLQGAGHSHQSVSLDGNVNHTVPSFLFTCKTGDYVNVLYTCDGVVDCNDGSDERDCSLVVERDRMKCESGGPTISVWNSCDGHQDCPDNSDEDTCVLLRCDSKRFRCDNLLDTLRCIPNKQPCDSASDCLQAEDELHHNCSQTGDLQLGPSINGNQSCIQFGSTGMNNECGTCEIGEYHCRGTSTCIAMTSLCDGLRDCLRADDEKFCNQTLSPQCQGTMTDQNDVQLICNDTLTMRRNIVSETVWHNERILHIDGIGFNSFQQLVASKIRFPRHYVAVLSMQYNAMRSFSSRAFQQLPNLRKLYLKGNPIRGDKGFQFLYNLKLLQYLNMEDTVNTDFPFALVSYDLLNNHTTQLRVDIDLPFQACCRLLSLLDSNCLPDTTVFRTCEQLIPTHTTNALWAIVAVGIILNMAYITTESKHRKDDEMKFMSIVTIFIANIIILVCCIGLGFESTRTRGRYYMFDEVWQESYSCWLVSVFWSIGYLLYFLALIILVCQVFAQRYMSVEGYYSIIGSRRFASYVFVIVIIPMVPVVLPLSTSNNLKEYVDRLSPLCNSFLDLVGNRMTASGKTYAACIFIGSPAAALGVNLIFGVIYLFKLCRRPIADMPDPTPRKTRWSSVITVVIGQVYGLTVGAIAALLFWGVVTMEMDTIQYLSLCLLPTFSLVSPCPFLVSTFLKSEIFKDISDRFNNNRKSTLRRTGGFNRRASRNYQKLSTYLEAGGKVTPSEALLMSKKMVDMLTNFHAEGMVCDNISTDFVVIGVDQKSRILEYNLVVTTEYPKWDVHEWRCQRDVAAFGEVLGCMLQQLQPAKQKRMSKKRVSFRNFPHSQET